MINIRPNVRGDTTHLEASTSFTDNQSGMRGPDVFQEFLF